MRRLSRELDAATVKDAKGRCRNGRDPKRRAAAQRLARAKEREANVRRDHAHKTASAIVANSDLIALEKLGLRRMTRSARGTAEQPGRGVQAKTSLNRRLLDAAIGLLFRLIVEKAERAVRTVVWVDAKFSSQTCGRCRLVCAKSRRRRRFACVGCGWQCHADVAAALEILRRAQLERMSTLSRARTPLRTQDAA